MMKKIILGLSLILACVTEGTCMLPHQNMPYAENDLNQIISPTLDRVRESDRIRLREYVQYIQNQDEDIEIRRDSFYRLKIFILHNAYNRAILRKLNDFYLDVLA